jgi:hypothetical protein
VRYGFCEEEYKSILREVNLNGRTRFVPVFLGPYRDLPMMPKPFSCLPSCPGFTMRMVFGMDKTPCILRGKLSGYALIVFTATAIIGGVRRTERDSNQCVTMSV